MQCDPTTRPQADAVGKGDITSGVPRGGAAPFSATFWGKIFWRKMTAGDRNFTAETASLSPRFAQLFNH